MFSCARVKDDLIIQINCKRAVTALLSLVFTVILLLWVGWIVVVKVEATRLKGEVYRSISDGIALAMQDTFDKSHGILLKLENCQAQLNHTKAVSSDLAKMVNKKLMEGNEEVAIKKK